MFFTRNYESLIVSGSSCIQYLVQDARLKIKIKIEIAMNPPDGADKTVEYVNFPLDFPVSAYNPLFLKNALFQFGPWKGTEIELNKKFINDELQKKIASINWNETKLDVRKFLRPEKAEVLDLWSVEFFEKKLLKLKMK